MLLIQNFIKRSFGFVFLFSCTGVTAAWAHPLDIGVLVLTGSGTRIAAHLEFNPQVVHRLIVTARNLTEFSAVEKTELLTKTLWQKPITIAGAPCEWIKKNEVKLLSPTNLALDAFADCPALTGDLEFELPFLKQMDASYNLLAKIDIGGVERLQSAEPLHPSLKFTLGSPDSNPFRFLRLGLEHIGLWPSEWYANSDLHLPAGLDHIFFVLALLLAGDDFLTLLKMVTGFTLGHTISLTLAAFGIVNAPGRMIEFLVALTIAAVASESVFNFRIAKQWRICIVIGLIHGLGFAAALTDLHLPFWPLIFAVFSFNVGVELGQGFFIALFFPALFVLRQTRGPIRKLLPLISILVFAMSLYWVFNRGETLWRSF